MDKIAIVLVTFNRLQLLRECINRINSYTFNTVTVIVNNGSTDGTKEFLETLNNNQKFIILEQTKNLGGTAGFYTGIKYCINNIKDANYIWLMDDDTFIHQESQKKLIEKFELNDQIGFVNSHVIHQDGKAHRMNVPRFNKKYIINSKEYLFNDFLEQNAFIISTGSFVSLMIKVSVIKEVGFPIKDYFIWVDDSEYTARIVKHGYLGLLSIDSIVTHYTQLNNGTNITTDTDSNAWRYYFLLRNKFHYYKTVQQSKLVYFIFLEIPGYLYLILKRRTAKWNYFKNWLRGVSHGIFFDPKIEKNSEEK